MRDPSDLPHAKTRLAIFWILFASWPVFFLVFDLWPGQNVQWFQDVGSGLAAVTATAYLLGKFLFQDTQAEIIWRLRHVEDGLNAWDESVARYFPEITPSGGGRPAEGGAPATGGSGRARLRLAFSRKDPPRSG